MRRSKNKSSCREQNRTAYDSAEQKNHGRKNRQCKRSEKTASPEKYYPYQTIHQSQNGVHDKISRKQFLRRKPLNRPGDIYYHRPETTEPSDLFENLNRFVAPYVYESVFVF